MQNQYREVQKLIKIIPLDFILQYDPPMIGMVYKVNENQTKKRLYQIFLRDLIYINDANAITKQLFEEHKIHLNPVYVSFDQIKKLITKLLDNFNQRKMPLGDVAEGIMGKDLNKGSGKGDIGKGFMAQGSFQTEKISFGGPTGDKGGRYQEKGDNDFGGLQGKPISKLAAADNQGPNLDEEFEIDDYEGF